VTLPWAHRRTIGRVRAFVRTAVMATFRPRRLAANIAGPVSWADAVAFRRVTVALAAGSVALALTVIAFLPDNVLAPALHHPLVWWAELLAVPVAWVGLWLATLAMAGVASYWFHPRSISVAQQNRAVALSLYGCSPLAVMPAFAACLFGLAWFADADGRAATGIATTFGCGLFAVAVFVAAFWWWSTIALLRHTTHCGVARQLCLAVGLPIAWAVLGAVFAVGLPLAYLWLALVLKSFQVPG